MELCLYFYYYNDISFYSKINFGDTLKINLIKLPKYHTLKFANLKKKKMLPGEIFFLNIHFNISLNKQKKYIQHLFDRKKTENIIFNHAILSPLIG